MNVQPTITFFKLCNEPVFEKIHLKACKNFSGINRRATNLAVVGEASCYPFMFDIVVNMLRYDKRLCTSGDILLRKAYKESSAAHDQDIFSWIGCVITILKLLDLDIFTLSKANFNHSIINKPKAVNNKVWNKQLFHDQRKWNIAGNKIRTYRTYKTNIKQEK